MSQSYINKGFVNVKFLSFVSMNIFCKTFNILLVCHAWELFHQQLFLCYDKELNVTRLGISTHMGIYVSVI